MRINWIRKSQMWFFTEWKKKKKLEIFLLLLPSTPVSSPQVLPLEKETRYRNEFPRDETFRHTVFSPVHLAKNQTKKFHLFNFLRLSEKNKLNSNTWFWIYTIRDTVSVYNTILSVRFRPVTVERSSIELPPQLHVSMPLIYYYFQYI